MESIGWECFLPSTFENDILRLVKKSARSTHYARLPTEQPNPRTQKIDRLPITKILEIINQEDTVVPRAVRRVLPSVAQGVRMIVNRLKEGGRLFFAGAGTSGRLGILEAAECPPTFNTSPSLVQAIMAGGKKAVFRSQEGAEDRNREAHQICRKELRKKDILVGIAASGVTPFVGGALRAARQKGAKTILVACNMSSPLRGMADCLIAPKVGPEVIAGSTRLKAGTATKLVLNMLTVASMIRLGKVYRNFMVDLQPKSRKLTARALRLIQDLGSVDAEKALACFRKARKRVKEAILMARKGWDLATARKRLRSFSGSLEKALAS